MENQQKTGAFKFRGATYKLMQLSNKELERGVLTASAGNHAQGVAYAAAKLGTKATVFMPKGTPDAKINATKNYGANIVITGESFQEAYEASKTNEIQTGAVYIHPFDDRDIIAGQGTVGLEMLIQEDRLDTLIVPVGGGGLISGIAVIAKHINPSIQIIGVEAHEASSMYNVFYQKSQSSLTFSTIADGIAVERPGQLTTAIIKKYVDNIVTVTDEAIATSILYMLERNKMLIEGASAAALAALFTYHKKIKSRHCGIIMSGGNIDINTIPKVQQLVERKADFSA